MLQGVIIISYPDSYNPQRWHGTLIAMAITILVALFNIFLAQHLPLVEGLILVLHLTGFVAILVPLWVMAPRTPSSQVWTSFVDGGPWGSGKFSQSSSSWILADLDQLALLAWLVPSRALGLLLEETLQHTWPKS